MTEDELLARSDEQRPNGEPIAAASLIDDLAACQALHDEVVRAGAVAMQDRAQKVLWDARCHLAARDIAKIAAIDIAKLGED